MVIRYGRSEVGVYRPVEETIHAYKILVGKLEGKGAGVA
jgi:hypothetical protein